MSMMHEKMTKEKERKRGKEATIDKSNAMHDIIRQNVDN
jgi:hypothetical protein